MKQNGALRCNKVAERNRIENREEKRMQMIVPQEKDGLMLSQLLVQTAADVPMWAIKEAMKKRDVRVAGVSVSAA